MKKKGILLGYFIALACGLYWFLHTEALYTLLRQEEVQLFLPTASVVTDMLRRPGGLCEVLGKAGVQLYTEPTTALLLLSILLASIGMLIAGILRKLIGRWYPYMLALFPVWYLAKAHCNPFHTLDCTISIFFLLLFLYGSVSIRSNKTRLLFYPLSTLLVYIITGQLVALYGLLLLILSLFLNPKQWEVPVTTALGSIALTYLTLRLTPCIPIMDGLYSQAYQETQFHTDSYLYYIAIRTTTVLLIVFITALILKNINTANRIYHLVLTVLLAVVFGRFVYLHRPNPEERMNNRMEELAYLSYHENWDGILQKFVSGQASNYPQLNTLCLALAKKGELGDRLFAYNVGGLQTLLVSWDQRYYTSVLLSDIHYAIGDISLSESYAMEGLTLAKRGGSPRMLQRLVKISLIRQEWEVAEKYLFLLSQMPAYRAWAETYQAYLRQPEKIKGDPELAGRPLSTQADNLFSMLSVDDIWTEHQNDSHKGKLAKVYLGSSYLLGKKLDKFESFLLQHESASSDALPKHFQEAWLIAAISKPSLLESIQVDGAVLNRFKQFQQDVKTVSKNDLGLRQLHRKYGDTYWFYYYCKN